MQTLKLYRSVLVIMISSDGPVVIEFEEHFSEIVQRRFGIAVTNGTTALEIALRALGLTKDDEVIVPDFMIISAP